MNQIFKTIMLAIQKVFTEKKFVGLFFLLVLIMLFLFVFLPTLTPTGNTLLYQLSIRNFRDYVLMGTLASLSALFITMQIYGIGQTKRLAANLGKSGASTLGALLASLLATATCPSCIAGLLGIFGIGLGGTFFLLDYSNYFIFGIIAILLISLYFSARKIAGICNKCE